LGGAKKAAMMQMRVGEGGAKKAVMLVGEETVQLSLHGSVSGEVLSAPRVPARIPTLI